MSDPFLRATGDEADDADGSASADQRRRAWLPQAVIDMVPLASVDQFVSRMETWAELTGELATEMIPEDQDDAGSILVTGRTDTQA